VASFPTLALALPSPFLTTSTVSSSTHRVGLFHPTAAHMIHTPGVVPAAKLGEFSSIRPLLPLPNRPLFQSKLQNASCD